MPIVDKLKEALKPSRKDSAEDGDLGKLLAASAKKVLLQRIEFEPASKSFSYQLESLKSKYVLLNSRAEGASRHRSGDELQARKPGTDVAPEGYSPCWQLGWFGASRGQRATVSGKDGCGSGCSLNLTTICNEIRK